MLLILLLSAIARAGDYSAKKIVVDSIEVLQLTDAAHNTEVSIVPSIGNIAYEMKVNGRNIFWTPFETLAEFKAKPALCGNPFLGPWANRIDQNAYYAAGRKFILNPELGNIRHDGNGKPIHGLLLFSSAWQVTSLRADDRAAESTSRLEFWKHPDLMAQFPFAHTIEMTYRLRDGVLEVETLLENHSAESMPVAIGYHPYFRVHDAPRDQWKVHLAARDRLLLSSMLIPTGERETVSFQDPLPLQGTQLDDVFTNLIRNADGRAEFFVQGEKERVTVAYGPKFTVAVVYAPRGRNFICFEPMAAITNAFNLAHTGAYRELQTIPAGGSWRESFWVRPSRF